MHYQSEKQIILCKQMTENGEELFFVAHYPGYNDIPTTDVLYPAHALGKVTPYHFETSDSAQLALDQVRNNIYFDLGPGCENIDKEQAQQNLTIGTWLQSMMIN